MLLLPWLFACEAVTGTPQGDVEGETSDEPYYTPDSVPTSIQDLGCDACGGDCSSEHVEYAVRYHTTEDVVYFDPPGVGGPHDYCWIDRGVYTAPVSDERLVHNLEHGDIGILWNCPEGCSDAVSALTNAARNRTSEFVLSPNSDIPTRFAFVAWNYRLLLDCPDTAALQQFIDAHLDQGPEERMGGVPSPDECGDAYE